jgi:hypothetical protein
MISGVTYLPSLRARSDDDAAGPCAHENLRDKCGSEVWFSDQLSDVRKKLGDLAASLLAVVDASFKKREDVLLQEAIMKYVKDAASTIAADVTSVVVNRTENVVANLDALLRKQLAAIQVTIDNMTNRYDEQFDAYELLLGASEQLQCV